MLSLPILVCSGTTTSASAGDGGNQEMQEWGRRVGAKDYGITAVASFE